MTRRPWPIWAPRCTRRPAFRRLRGQVFGLQGQRSMGMGTATIDPAGWYRQFGVDVDDWDMLETVERARGLADDDPRVRRYADWVRSAFGGVRVTQDSLHAGIKLYLASKEIVQERGYDFVAVKCLPYMPSVYTTFCSAIAMLNDEPTRMGPRSALSPRVSQTPTVRYMQVLKLIGGGPVNFADLFELDPTTFMAHVLNCGSRPPSWRREMGRDLGAQRDAAVRLAAAWHCRSTWPSRPGDHRPYEPRRGPLRDADHRRRGARRPAAGPASFGAFCPRTHIRLDCDVNELMKHVRSNHISSIYGDYRANLAEFCRLARVEPIML